MRALRAQRVAFLLLRGAQADLKNAKIRKVMVNGMSVNHDDACTLYAALAGHAINVAVTLEKGAGPRPFAVDIISHTGETLASMDTRLSATLLAKPLLAVRARAETGSSPTPRNGSPALDQRCSDPPGIRPMPCVLTGSDQARARAARL